MDDESLGGGVSPIFLGIFTPKIGEDDFQFDSYFLEGLKPTNQIIISSQGVFC